MTVWSMPLNIALYLRHFSNTYRYFRAHRSLPNYVEPRGFNEKTQWRKLFDRNPLLPVFVDKVAVRSYVSDHAPSLKLPRFLWTGSDPDAIPYDRLPERFVLKPSHRSGDIIFVRSREDIDRDRFANVCRDWLKRPFGRSRREWAYQKLEGRLIVEELLETDADPGQTLDYRCYVCNGVVEAFMVIPGIAEKSGHRFIGEGLIFDRAWKRMPYKRTFSDEPVRADPTRPKALEEMIAAAESLGREVDCVRVDFLMVGDDVYFSELTIYQGSGMNDGVAIDQTMAGPATESFYALLGRKWTLPQMSLRDLLRHGFLGA